MRGILTSIALALLAISAMPVHASAQCATWDPRFSDTNDFNGSVHALIAFDDGSGSKLYAGGNFTAAGGAPAHSLARWNGSSWTPFGAPGGTPYTENVQALAVFDDGTGPALFIAGYTPHQGLNYPFLTSWNGTSWRGPGSPGSFTTTGIATMIAFDDGSGPALFVGGTFPGVSGSYGANIAKWNGTTWSAVGPPESGADGAVQSLGVFNDGSGPALYAGGSFGTVAGVSAAHIAKWNGSTWSALGLPGSGTSGPVQALLAFNDGSGTALFAGGTFSTAGGISAVNIAKWKGGNWSAVGAPGDGTNGAVATLASFHDASGSALYVGGTFTAADGGGASNIAKWNGSTWSPLQSGTDQKVWTLAVFNDGSQSALYAGGDLTTAGGVQAINVGRWNGTAWSGLVSGGGGMNGTVAAFSVFDDGTGPALYVGGGFTSAGGVGVHNIAKWNGTSWSSVGGGVYGGSIQRVASLAVFDDGSGPALFAAGQFTTAGGVPAANIAKWDGSSWSALGNGVNNPVNALCSFVDISGPALCVAGAFNQAGAVNTGNVARWNGTSWSTLGGGVNLQVYQLATYDDGSGSALYAGGNFTTAGGVPANRIAKWNGTNWQPLGSGLSAEVDALAVYDSGSGAQLYAGGQFSFFIQRWNGTSWSTIGGTNSAVFALAAGSDSSGSFLYVGGQFTSAGPIAASRIAKFDGTNWHPLGVGTDFTIRALAAFDDGSDGAEDVYAGGQFSAAGGLSSKYIAEWHGCVSTAYCFGDGSTANCPCSNNGQIGHGCENSGTTGGALLSSSGTASPDTLVLVQSGELTSALSIFLQGSLSLGAPVSFGDGLRCAGGSLKRLYVKNATSGTASAPGLGDLSITARSAALGDAIPSGATRFYQVYYRDPNLAFCPSPQGNSFNVGNALRVAW